jgi:hypothetical protein
VADGKQTSVGGPRLLARRQLTLSPDLQARPAQAGTEGKTVGYVAQDGRVVGGLALADAIRPESHAAVRRLKALGVRVALLAGDSQAVAAQPMDHGDAFVAVPGGSCAGLVGEVGASGAAKAGGLPAWTRAPEASSSWNLTGIVWPAL